MNVAVLTLGTRGDVQPYVALGAGLKQAGHEVTLVTGKGFDELVAGRGIHYVALDQDLLELARSPEGKAADGRREYARRLPHEREAEQRGHDERDPGTPGDLDRRMIGGDVGLGFRPDRSLTPV